tara:strand:- start:764 stop:1504 length:741 start_codon:yes stop_codon:yes gene_type:complete
MQTTGSKGDFVLKDTLGRLKAATDSLIIGRAEKLSLLERLVTQRPMVSVRRGRDDTVFASSLLDVDETSNALWIDELSPTPEPGLAVGERVSVFGEVDGTPLGFRTSVREQDVRKGLPIHVLGLPRMLRLQRHRVHPRFVPARPIPVYLVDPSAGVLEGALRDISLGGICVSMTAKAVRTLGRGVQIPSCTVSISGSDVVQAALEIRYVRKEPKTAKVFVGGRFVKLKSMHKARLESFLQTLQVAA